MLRLLACAVVLSGCMVSAAGNGVSGNLSWAFTINNTLPPTAVHGGGGGLVVVVTYADGSSTTHVVAPGGSLRLPANGTAATVRSGGGQEVTVGPQSDLYWTSTGWSNTPPRPSGGG